MPKINKRSFVANMGAAYPKPNNVNKSKEVADKLKNQGLAVAAAEPNRKKRVQEMKNKKEMNELYKGPNPFGEMPPAGTPIVSVFNPPKAAPPPAAAPAAARKRSTRRRRASSRTMKTRKIETRRARKSNGTRYD